jgi:hypothetical protein
LDRRVAHRAIQHLGFGARSKFVQKDAALPCYASAMRAPQQVREQACPAFTARPPARVGLCREKITERVIGVGIIDQGGMSPPTSTVSTNPTSLAASEATSSSRLTIERNAVAGFSGLPISRTNEQSQTGNLQSGSVIRRAKSLICRNNRLICVRAGTIRPVSVDFR